MEWAIGLGGGLLGIVAVSVMSFLHSARMLDLADECSKRAAIADSDRDRALSDLSAATDMAHALERNIDTHKQNELELKREIADLGTKNKQLAATAAATETSLHDIVRALESGEPARAVPVALRSELDRLRERMSAGAQAAATSAPGDPGRREAGLVHVATDVRRS